MLLLPPLLQGTKDTPLISQPPHDRSLNKASMYHYTWGVIYKNGSQETWKWDKRFYTAADDALKVCSAPAAAAGQQQAWAKPAAHHAERATGQPQHHDSATQQRRCALRLSQLLQCGAVPR